MQQNQLPNQNNQNEVAESEDDSIGVGTSKQSKIVIIAIAAVLISGVIYFMFLKEPAEDPSAAPANEIVVEKSGVQPVRDKGVDFNTEDILDVAPNNNLFAPKTQDNVPALPELPQLPEEIKQQIASGVKKEDTYTKEEVDKMVEEKMKLMMEDQMSKLASQQQQKASTPGIQVATPPIQASDDFDPNNILNESGKEKVKEPVLAEDGHVMTDDEILAEQQKAEAADLLRVQKNRALQERRTAPIFKMSGGSGPSNSLPQNEDAIILSFTDNKIGVKDQTPEVVPTQVTDLSRVILQGKVIEAVLETAVDTGIAATVRAVITRDIYAEEGKNILIPRGSRVVGTYGTDIKSGQTRVTVNWNRIIRVDGMSLNIASIGADRLGRAGVEGDLDNKYAQKLANSFLSSVLTVGTSLAVEKVSGSNGITSTVSSLTGQTTQTSGKASDYALVDATQQFMDDAKQIVDDIAEQKPVIRIPQGEKVVIMVTQDVTLPVFKRTAR